MSQLPEQSRTCFHILCNCTLQQHSHLQQTLLFLLLATSVTLYEYLPNAEKSDLFLSSPNRRVTGPVCIVFRIKRDMSRLHLHVSSPVMTIPMSSAIFDCINLLTCCIDTRTICMLLA